MTSSLENIVFTISINLMVIVLSKIFIILSRLHHSSYLDMTTASMHHFMGHASSTTNTSDIQSYMNLPSKIPPTVCSTSTTTNTIPTTMYMTKSLQNLHHPTTQRRIRESEVTARRKGKV